LEQFLGALIDTETYADQLKLICNEIIKEAMNFCATGALIKMDPDVVF